MSKRNVPLSSQRSPTTSTSTTSSSAVSSTFSSPYEKNNKYANFLPSCWESDERMSGLMSMFKRREVNPAEYDAKMSFWTDLISSSGAALRNPIFSLKQLTRRFQRKDRVPAGLENVVRDMLVRGLVVPAAEYAKSIGQQGWVSWGVDLFIKRPLSWVWSASRWTSNNNADDGTISSMEFVLPNVVQEIGEEILRRRREALEGDESDSDPLAQDVVAYSALLRSFKNDLDEWRLIDDRSLDLALCYLQNQRQIAVDETTTGGGQRAEKVIKFKLANEAEAPKMTESDRQILSVKRATETLEHELSTMDQQVQRLDREARMHVRAGNRTKAKTCLRQKLQVLKRMKEKETAFDNLTGIMNQLAQTKEQKAIFDAYKVGVVAFKNNLASHGLSPENVDKTMDDIQEALSDHEDIRNAISMGPVGFGNQLDTSQEDLEQELNDLLEEDVKEKKQKMKEKRTIRLPDVPLYDDEGEEEEQRREETQQDDRLKRLRRALETS